MLHYSSTTEGCATSQGEGGQARLANGLRSVDPELAISLWLAGWLVGLVSGWLAGWLTDRLGDWLAGWLGGLLFRWVVD